MATVGNDMSMKWSIGLTSHDIHEQCLDDRGIGLISCRIFRN